jgi:outer membrane protein assembly factor BamB
MQGLLATLALVAPGLGPDEGWTSYRGDPAMTGVAAGSLSAALEVRWTYDTGKAIVSSPVISNGIVYVGSDDAHLHAIDLATGEERWRFETGDMIEAPPLVRDGTVYVGSADFWFYAVDAATGELRWKYETDDQVLGGANWVPGEDGANARVVVGSYDNHLYGFDAVTGEKLWAYETGNYVNGTPAVRAGLVVFGGCDAILHVVSAATGEAVAKVPLGEACHVAGSVALAGERVYFGHYGNAFVCVDLSTESVVWEHVDPSFPFFSSPAIAPDRVVFGGRNKKVTCVQRETGEVLWTKSTRRKVDGSPVICGDKVVFGSGDGRLYLVSLEDGADLWSYEVGRSLFSSPAVADGLVVIGSEDGVVYAFGAEEGGE